jgi:hypothetical protein
MLKLKDKEEKQTRSRKPRLSKDKTVKSSANKTKTCRKTVTISKKTNKENETLNDPHIAAAVQNLENVIQSSQTIFDDHTSDEEF